MTIRKASNEFKTLLRTAPEDPQYRLFSSEDDHEKIIAHLSTVAAIFPEYVVMLCNRSHPRLEWVSANCPNVFGITPAAFMRLPLTAFFDSIHPEDLAHLQQCFEFINSSEPYDPITHRFVMYYRYRKQDGGYVHIRDEKLAIETEGSKYIYFTMFRDITAQEKFFHVKLDVIRMSKGSALKVYSYHPRQYDQVMTPRQNDIAKLIIQGFSTQEIASNLHVSINTVKNHKRALFRKVNVATSVQLINLFAVRGERE